jgi:hypothetical protein
MISALLLGTFTGGSSAVQADEGPFRLARTNVYQGNEYYPQNEYGQNLYGKSPLPKAPLRFTRPPAPQYQTPPDYPAVTPGKQYTFKVAFLCEHPGYVDLYVEGTSHSCRVLNWTPTEVTFELPNMGVVKPGMPAELRVTRPDGFAAAIKPVLLVNPPDLVEHEALPSDAQGQIGRLRYSGPVLQPVGG